ncbi:MAG: MarR family transcriptional regulator [Acidobacteriota bacterium]|jgi:DNA-binding MarR family transcriptional regulator
MPHQPREVADAMKEKDLEAAADRLHSVAIHLLRRVRVEDKKSGLSPARLSALSVVVFGGPLSLGNLAAAEQVTPPTMTRLVQALEQEGLLERRPDPEDGRGILIAATRAGDKLLNEARQRRIRRLVDLLAALPPTQLQAVSQATDALTDLFA